MTVRNISVPSTHLSLPISGGHGWLEEATGETTALNRKAFSQIYEVKPLRKEACSSRHKATSSCEPASGFSPGTLH